MNKLHLVLFTLFSLSIISNPIHAATSILSEEVVNIDQESENKEKIEDTTPDNTPEVMLQKGAFTLACMAGLAPTFKAIHEKEYSSLVFWVYIDLCMSVYKKLFTTKKELKGIRKFFDKMPLYNCISIFCGAISRILCKTGMPLNLDPLSDKTQTIFNEVLAKMDMNDKDVKFGTFNKLHSPTPSLEGVTLPGNSILLLGHENANPEQLKFVIAHELTHVKNNDIPNISALSIITPLGMEAAFDLYGKLSEKALNKLQSFLDLKEDSFINKGINNLKKFNKWVVEDDIPAKTLKAILTHLIIMKYRRIHEYTADAGSAKAFGTTQPAIDFFKSLSENECQGGILHSHPTIEQRIAALQKLSREELGNSL